jgi:hypothetical protein
MTPEKLKSIKDSNRDNPIVLQLIAEIEGLRSRITYLEGFKDGVGRDREPKLPELPRYTTRQNVPFFSRG